MIPLLINGPISEVITSPKMDLSKWVCKILVLAACELSLIKVTFNGIPKDCLKRTSTRIPEINKRPPTQIAIFKYLSESISLFFKVNV